MQSPAIAARGVRKRFGSVQALDRLDLNVSAGEIVGLLGPNGSGKTTFIRAAAGLVRIDEGQIEVLGRSPSSASAEGLVGYMPQSPALYTELTVEENLRFFTALFGVADPSARVDEVLVTVELREWKRSPLSTLSGGMRTRVSLAAAPLHRPRLLLLDEPTVGVDPVRVEPSGGTSASSQAAGWRSSYRAT